MRDLHASQIKAAVEAVKARKEVNEAVSYTHLDVYKRQLLMQWGIINGNDPFLYGEKVKAYLIRGARHLPGYDIWPNERVGYGALCVAKSLPGE